MGNVAQGLAAIRDALGDTYYAKPATFDCGVMAVYLIALGAAVYEIELRMGL